MESPESITDDQVLELVRERIQDPETRIDRSSILKTEIFPPASTDALIAAEDQLGFQLAPLLRRLYREVGNGGFGPGYGILGVEGGYSYDEGQTIVEAHEFVSSMCEYQVAWPFGLLPICDWGDGVWSCIDCTSNDYAITTSDDEGLTRTAYDLRSWLLAWCRGVCLWDEMFEFEEVTRRNPFTGGPFASRVRRRAKGKRLR